MRRSRISFAVIQVCLAAPGRFRYRGRQFYYLFPANKVGKSRDGQPPSAPATRRRKRKLSVARASAKRNSMGVRRAATRFDSTRPVDATRCVTGSGPYRVFRTFGFRLPSTNNGHPDARATGGGEFAFQIFVLSLAASQLPWLRDQWVSNLALVSHLTAPRPENTFLRVAGSRNL